jgi:hypothetical protein
MKTQGAGAPGQDPGDRVSSAPKPTTSSNRAAEMGNDSRSQAKPTVDKNVPTGGAPAAGAAALTKQMPKPATSAAKPAPAAKDDIWDDSKIQRTGEGGTETAADFQRNSELYNKRNAAGGQRPAPEAPKPATPTRPSAPRPATPSAGSSSNPISNSPDGPAPKMTNPTAAKPAAPKPMDAVTDGRTNQGSRYSDTVGRPTDPKGTVKDTVGRSTDSKGTYMRASGSSTSNDEASPANDTVGTSQNQNRTPAAQFKARGTKLPTSALNTRNNTSVAESFTDTIMKVLKG